MSVSSFLAAGPLAGLPASSQLLAAATVEVGGYISIWKCAVYLLIVLIWARLLTWTDKDAEDAHLPRVPLNLGFVLGFVAANGLFFFLPGFIVAFPVFVLVLIVEVVTYLVIRNQKVGLGDLSKRFKAWVGSLVPKGKGKTLGKGEVQLSGKYPFEPPEGENVQAEQAGYQAVQEIFTEPLRKGAERIEVVSGDARSSVKYYVDGMSYDGAPVGKNEGSTAMLLLKESMGLDTGELRKPQTGTMKAVIDGQKHEMRLITAGSTAGESLIVDIDWKKRHELRVEQLGFSDDQLKIVRAMIQDAAGVVLLATPKGQGLTTLEYALLRAHDAFLTHIQTVERAPEVELEGITQNEIPANPQPGEEAKQVNWVCSQEPDIIMVARVDDPRSAGDLVKFAGNGKKVYAGIRAGSAFEALDLWRKLVGDDKLALKNLKLVIAGRVMRKLCDACKIDYAPDPDTLRKMNLQPDKVSKLYTARTTPLKDSRGNTVVCEFCLDLRFKGRTGVYELFTIDDEVRQVIAQGGSVNQLKMLFKKQKRRYIQEAALTKAIAGDTSLQEVARVMKATAGGEGRSGGTTSSGGGGGGSPRPSTGGGGRPSTRSSPPSTSSSPRRTAPPTPRG